MNPTLILFVKQLQALTAFYRDVFALHTIRETDDLALLQLGHGEMAFRVLLHAIPAHIAATIVIVQPPVRRDDSAMKLSLPVSSLAQARARALALGGVVDAVEREWDYEGRRVVDGNDPEGNVIQLHEAISA